MQTFRPRHIQTCVDQMTYGYAMNVTLSDSQNHFSINRCVDMDSENENQNENVDDIFDELKDIKKKHPTKCICSYININSLRNRFGFIKDLLISDTCEMLTIAETRLDEPYSSAQFQIENFHLWRADRTVNGGGLLTYIRSDLWIVSKCDSFFSNEVSFIWLRPPTHPLQMKV